MYSKTQTHAKVCPNISRIATHCKVWHTLRLSSGVTARLSVPPPSAKDCFMPSKFTLFQYLTGQQAAPHDDTQACVGRTFLHCNNVWLKWSWSHTTEMKFQAAVKGMWGCRRCSGAFSKPRQGCNRRTGTNTPTDVRLQDRYTLGTALLVTLPCTLPTSFHQAALSPTMHSRDSPHAAATHLLELLSA
jgi:hypothetical protein